MQAHIVKAVKGAVGAGKHVLNVVLQSLIGDRLLCFGPPAGLFGDRFVPAHTRLSRRSNPKTLLLYLLFTIESGGGGNE